MKAAGLMVAVSLVLAFAVSGLAARKELSGIHSAPESVDSLVSLIRFGGKDGRSCADLINPLAGNLFLGEIEAAHEDFNRDPALPMVRIWWKGVSEGDLRSALSGLESLPDQRNREAFRGDLLFLGNRYGEALSAYLAEASAHPGDGYASRSAIHLAQLEEDLPKLRELLDDPRHAAALRPTERLRYEIRLERPLPILEAQLQSLFAAMISPFAMVALLCALVWAGILTSFHAPTRRLHLWSLAAFVLGIAAASLAEYLGTLQEDLRGFRFSGEEEPLRQALQLLAGPALRAETAKLLAFLPIAIALRRGGDTLLVMVLAALVGTGFSFHDNVLDFASSRHAWNAGAAILAQNALAFSLSGIAGHALWRMISRSFRGWEDFLLVYLSVILAHAFYLGLLQMPSLREYSVLSPIFVAIVAYRYFDPLRHHLDVRGLHRRIAPLGIFVTGVAFVLCLGLVESAAWTTFQTALGVFAISTAQMIPVSFAFISRFRDL